jgi:hypothetical protein
LKGRTVTSVFVSWRASGRRIAAVLLRSLWVFAG